MNAERFDPDKDRRNREKHQLSLDFGDVIFADSSRVVYPTIRERDEEERLKVIGLVEGKLYTAIFVWRDGVPRYISVRRSNRGEERLYRASG